METEFKHPNDIHVAHFCNGKIRGYPSVVCSSCREAKEKDNLTINQLVEMANELQGKLYYKFGYKNPENQTKILVWWNNCWQMGFCINEEIYIENVPMRVKADFWKPLPPKPTLV